MRTVLLALLFAVSLTAPCDGNAQAQGELLIPGRPMSSVWARDKIVAPRYMGTVEGLILGRRGDVLQDALQMQSSINPNAPFASNPPLSPLDRGVASPAAVVANHVADLQLIGAANPGRWFQCMKVKLVGICYRITWSGIKFYNMWSYHLPYQKVENVDQPLKTKYYPKLSQRALVRPAVDSLELAAPRIAGLAARSAGNSANWVMTRYLNQPQLPSINIGRAQRNAADDVDRAYQDDDYRLRNPERSAGGRYNEFHVMPTFADPIIAIYGALAATIYYGPFGPFQYIHNFKSIGVWNSDWPGLNIITRYGMPSYAWFPSEMIELYGAPLLGIGAFPQICSGLNMRNRGGHRGQTPLDLILRTPPGPGLANPFSSRYDQALIAASLSARGAGCLGFNQGPWLPVTHLTPTTYRTAAAAVGTAKGLNIARRMFPASFYVPNLKESGKFKDRIQWIRNDNMRSATGARCGPLERFPLEYGKGNVEPENPGDDHFVAVHWKYFRGCVRGRPLIIFDGLGKTQIKE